MTIPDIHDLTLSVHTETQDSETGCGNLLMVLTINK